MNELYRLRPPRGSALDSLRPEIERATRNALVDASFASQPVEPELYIGTMPYHRRDYEGDGGGQRDVGVPFSEMTPQDAVDNFKQISVANRLLDPNPLAVPETLGEAVVRGALELVPGSSVVKIGGRLANKHVGRRSANTLMDAYGGRG